MAWTESRLRTAIEQAARPWVARDLVTLHVEDEGPTCLLHIRPRQPRNVLQLSARLYNAYGDLFLADGTGHVGSFEITEEDTEDLVGLISAVLDGTAEVGTSTFLRWEWARSVRWPGQEWAFSVSLPLGLLPVRRTRRYEPYG